MQTIQQMKSTGFGKNLKTRMQKKSLLTGKNEG